MRQAGSWQEVEALISSDREERKLEEAEKGVINEGAYADFMLLQDFPDRYAADELHNIEVQQTWTGDKKVYDWAE